MAKRSSILTDSHYTTQDSRSTPKPIHSDLLVTYDLLYNKCGFVITQPQLETHNAEYGAYLFQVNRQQKHRSGN
jgi:hypothetical protein